MSVHGERQLMPIAVDGYDMHLCYAHLRLTLGVNNIIDNNSTPL